MARFRRSPVARAGSCVFALLAVLFAAALLTPSGLPLRAGEEAAMLAVLAAALASLTLTFGDRWEVGEEQLRYDNTWARRTIFRPRCLSWSEVESVTTWRRGVLALRARDGSRLVVDGVERFEEFRAAVEARVAAAGGVVGAHPRALPDGADGFEGWTGNDPGAPPGVR